MTEAIEYWAVIELMGHVRMAGKVSEVERFGAKCGRIDIPDGDGFKTQFFGGSSIYRETPCTEEVARAVAARSVPQPIRPWEMPERPKPVALPIPALRMNDGSHVPECECFECRDTESDDEDEQDVEDERPF